MSSTTISRRETTHHSATLDWVRLSHEEFREFCQRNPDLVAELTAEGKLVLMAPADTFGDSRNATVIAFLFNWNDLQPQPGIVFGATAGFILPNGAIRSPDAAWIPVAKWNALPATQRAPFSHICPDFVVELMSPSDRLLATQRKMDEYIANGALLGLLIDRKNRKVHVYRPGQTPQILDNPTQFSCDPELPGFALPMGRIF